MRAFIQRNRVFLIHFSFWWVYFSFLLYQFTYPRKGGEEINWLEEFFSALFHVSSVMLIVYVNYFYVLPRYLKHKNTLRYLVEFFIIFWLLMWAYIYAKRYWEDGYTHSRFAHYFYESRFIVQYAFNTLLIAVFVGMLKFVEDLFELEAKKKEIENEKLTSELRFLKAQINPHFLFNTLNNLYYLAFTQSPNTTEVIAKLSQMMRYMIYESNHPKVLLSKEIEYMQNYISLEKLRLNDEIPIQFEIKGKTDEVKIVPLILINFLENAFKHGISNNSPDAWVHISLELNEKNCIYTVENSKFPTENEPKLEKSGIGLQNARRRLDLSYPNAYELKIQEEANQYRIELKIYLG